MQCSFQASKQYTPSFTANAHVVRKSYYKLTDNLADYTVKRVTGGMSIETALSDIAGKTVESMKSTYGDSFAGVCEYYNLVKDKFPQSNLPDALKGLAKSFKLVDENGAFKKSPLRVFVIKPGTENIDNIAADTFVNNGVSGLKDIKAKNVRVRNVNDPELNIFAKLDCKVNNSKCNFISSESTAELNNVTVDKSILSTDDIFATNVISPMMTSASGSIFMHGENNCFDSLSSYFSIISSDGLVAKTVKSLSGDVLLEGKINKIGKVEADGLFSYKDLPESDNFVNYVNAKYIEAINAKGINYSALDSLSLFGFKNKVDYLNSIGNMELENVVANHVNSTGELVKFIGNSNRVENKIFAKNAISAKNLEANVLKCQMFIDEGNVKVKDLQITNL